MPTFADVFGALNAMRDDGIVQHYAVGDGMAALFYAETSRTYEVDAFLFLPQQGILVNLSQLYIWAKQKGFEPSAEHLLVSGVPVQILVASDGLEPEAVEQANTLDYDGVPASVMRPEHLLLLYARAGSEKRRDRARDLLRADVVNQAEFHAIVERHQLRATWQKFWG